MSKNNTGMSGGASYGGITIGNNKGNVNTTQDAQNQGMEQTTVTGMTGGKAGTVVAAGKITGGAGNSETHHQGRRDIKMGDHVQYAEGDHASMNQGAQNPTPRKKDPEI